jgi:hypothetical protein
MLPLAVAGPLVIGVAVIFAGVLLTVFLRIEAGETDREEAERRAERDREHESWTRPAGLPDDQGPPRGPPS